MSYYTGFAGLAKGVASGLALNEQKQKEDEQLARQQEQQQYERKRQAVADQQNSELHTQTVQGNKYKLQDMEQESVQNKRKQYLSDQVGQAIKLRDAGDVDSLYSLYGDVVNNQTLGDPKTGMYAYKVEKQPDGTANINAYDRNGQLVQTTAKGVTADQIIGTIYGQINPASTYATEQQTKAEKAKADREWQEKVGLKKMDILSEQEKMRVQNNYRLGELRYSNELGMGRDDHQSNNRINEKAFEYRFKPQEPGKAGTVPAGSAIDSSMGIQSASPQGLMDFVIHQESGGRHYAAGGGLTTSPVGARGITQVMPRTGVNPGFGVQPLRDNSEQEYRRFGQDYLTAMIGEFDGDVLAGLAAYNGGHGKVKAAIKKANSAGGSGNWLDYVPPETQNYVSSIAQRYSKAVGQTNSAVKNQTANNIGGRIDAVTKQVVEDFKGDDSSGLVGARVAATLSSAGTLLAKSLNAQGAERTQLFNQAGQVVDSLLKDSSLTPREKTEYRNKLLTNLLGEQSLSAVGNKMKFVIPTGSIAKQTQNAPAGNKRAGQRTAASNTQNPFIDPDAKLFEQSPDVDRSIVNSALRGG